MKSPDEVLREMRSAEVVAKDDDVPAITTLHLDVKDGRGRRFQGDFVYKVPNLGDQIQIGKLKAVYLPQGGLADVTAALLVEQICTLEVTLQFSDQHPRPTWWQPFHFYDATPVTALYLEARLYEDRFHGKDQAAEADSGDAGSGAHEAGGNEPDDPAPVGRKVPPATERPETIAAHTAGSS